MHHPDHERPYADLTSVPSELHFEDKWDGNAVCNLIRSKSANGETPAFLFIGRKEKRLLSEHLAGTFGRDAVATLDGTYYMGLCIVTIGCGSFLSTGGRKAVRTLQDPIARRPAWRDEDTDTLWRLRL